jgi:hypothetical protein
MKPAQIKVAVSNWKQPTQGLKLADPLVSFTLKGSTLLVSALPSHTAPLPMLSHRGPGTRVAMTIGRPPSSRSSPEMKLDTPLGEPPPNIPRVLKLPSLLPIFKLAYPLMLV